MSIYEDTTGSQFRNGKTTIRAACAQKIGKAISMSSMYDECLNGSALALMALGVLSASFVYTGPIDD
jgi:hypothetical protein